MVAVNTNLALRENVAERIILTAIELMLWRPLNRKARCRDILNSFQADKNQPKSHAPDFLNPATLRRVAISAVQPQNSRLRACRVFRDVVDPDHGSLCRHEPSSGIRRKHHVIIKQQKVRKAPAGCFRQHSLSTVGKIGDVFLQQKVHRLQSVQGVQIGNHRAQGAQEFRLDIPVAANADCEFHGYDLLLAVVVHMM